MRALLLIAAALVGCGPGVDFAGTYEGELTETWACSPAYASSSGTRTGPWKLTVVQDEGGARLQPGVGACSSLSLDPRGPTATVAPIKCPGTQEWGPTEIKGGQLTLQPSSERLSVSLSVRMTLLDGTCDYSAAGSLPKT